ncbi:hypothetical protein WN982_17715 [Paraburkholderia sp. IMGN_8]|uniref:hypothetical protein n=1 Tax=Paraburkholderia sp. IMGN_8 TaxID=3136564 RepID=UPI00310123EB
MPAPHRGDANKPISNQGKANAVGTQKNAAAKGKKEKNAKPQPEEKQHAISFPLTTTQRRRQKSNVHHYPKIHQKMARLSRQRPPARRAASDR